MVPCVHSSNLGVSRVRGRRWHLMRTTPRTIRTIHQSRQPTRLIPRQPGMNRLTRHPKPARHFHNRLAIMDNQRHSLIRLLHNTQLHNHERKCQASAETTVQDQPKQHNDIEPPRGFEPRTYALRVRCSTPELRRPAQWACQGYLVGLNPRRRRLLVRTKTLEKAIAAPAIIGFRSPAMARGIAAML